MGLEDRVGMPPGLLQLAGQGDHAPALPELSRYLAAGHRRVQQKEHQDHHHRRLRDPGLLEPAREAVETAGSEQYGAHQHQVPPHEQRQSEPAGAAGDLVEEL